jgi:hypothetical protein
MITLFVLHDAWRMLNAELRPIRDVVKIEAGVLVS